MMGVAIRMCLRQHVEGQREPEGQRVERQSSTLFWSVCYLDKRSEVRQEEMV